MRKKTGDDEVRRRLERLVGLIERSSVISPVVIQIQKATHQTQVSTFKVDSLLRTNSLLVDNLVRYVGRSRGEDWDNVRFLPHAIEALSPFELRNAVFGLETLESAPAINRNIVDKTCDIKLYNSVY